jgi:hypothetical protein
MRIYFYACPRVTADVGTWEVYPECLVSQCQRCVRVFLKPFSFRPSESLTLTMKLSRYKHGAEKCDHILGQSTALLC